MIGFRSLEASAGTGKTYAITRRWLRLLLVHAIPVERILVSTFTKAATAELRERLLVTLREARAGLAGATVAADLRAILDDVGGAQRDLAAEVDAALSRFDLAPISTIHGFCTALVARHGLELGADPEVTLVESSDDLVDELLGDALMADADLAPLPPDQAARIARALVAEGALDDAQVLLPPIAEGDAHARCRETLAALAELLSEAEARLDAVPKRSRPKTLRIMTELAHGDPADALVDSVRAKLAAGWPEAVAAMDAAREAIAMRRALALRRLADAMRRQLPAEQARAGVRSFDGVLRLVRDALADGERGLALAERVRAAYDAVIVDESQDSDAVQIAVFRTLFMGTERGTTAEPTRSLTVIGDPKQSIYRFRGADLASYRALAERAEADQALTTNFRSDGSLVAALNALYAARPEFADGGGEPIRYHHVDAATQAARIDDPQPDRAALCALWSDSEDRATAQRELAAQIAVECRRLLDERVRIVDRDSGEWRRIEADHIALLADDRHQLALLRRALLTLGIPCQQAGRGLGSVVASDEARDLRCWLDALDACEHGGERVLARLLALAASPLLGRDAAACLALGADPAAQAELAERCRAQARQLRRQGPLPALLRALDGELQRVLGGIEGERRLANWRHLGELLQARWAAGAREPALLARELGRQIASGDDDEALVRLETDLPAVQLVTIHGAKGLEYPVVFCPFLWAVKSAATPPPYAVVRRVDGGLLDLGSADLEQHQREERRQQDEERERLTYVALTRARHRCYLGLAAVSEGGKTHANGAERSPIARLLGLDAIEDRAAWPEAIATAMPVIAPEPSTAPERGVARGGGTVKLVLPPRPRPGLRPQARTVSFSGLSAGEHEFHVVRDHDEAVATADAAQTRDPGLLAGLGAGTGLGDRIHTLLEEVLGNRRELDAALGPDPAEGPELAMALRTILDAPIPLPGEDAAPSLRELGARSIAELHFLLPVGDCDPRGLADALLADPAIAGDPLRAAWAEHVAGWSFGRVAGFLQGYIDLTIERGGRWYVADYKTNQLSAYDATTCEHAMLEHDYLLQGRLYLVALHRHLRHHLDGYDPAQHLGGLVYAYVRGLPERGVWRERVAPEAVLALDALFAEGAS